MYRTLYPPENLIRAAAAEFGTSSANLPSFRKPMIIDQHLYDFFAFHRSLADPAAALERRLISATPFAAGAPAHRAVVAEVAAPRGDPSDPAGAAISRQALCARCVPVRTGRGLRQ